MANNKVYIHEYIDIIGHNREKYMHHMTANFSPRAQVERDQLCYGVWGVLGSTRRWPEVINIWEENGLNGLAESFRHETSGVGMQDPFLAKWWSKAAEFRSGGYDRILAPAKWTRTISELCADGVTGEVYAHEHINLVPGASKKYLKFVRKYAIRAYRQFGWELAGAFRTLMIDTSECILLWAIPTWEQWAEFERFHEKQRHMKEWKRRSQPLVTSFHRFLLVDAPLCPFKTHRQPAYSDQVEMP
jgi:hypothetical protein